MDDDLSMAARPEEIRDKTRVAAGFEIPDSRFEGRHPVPEQTVQDLVADNSFAGLVVHGRHSVPTGEVNLAAVTMTMSIDREEVGTGVGPRSWAIPSTPSPGCPGRWPATTGRSGPERGSRPGRSCIRPPARPGVFRADYESIGPIEVTFV